MSEIEELKAEIRYLNNRCNAYAEQCVRLQEEVTVLKNELASTYEEIESVIKHLDCA